MLHARSSKGPERPSKVQEAKKIRKQTILTSEAAIQIFKLRPALKSPIDDAENRLKTSSSIAKRFGVSPKTVRDIWIGRTWYRQTFPLDPERLDSSERLSKQMGRPKGSKDKSPRSRQRRSQESELGTKPISHLGLPNPAPAVLSTAQQDFIAPSGPARGDQADSAHTTMALALLSHNQLREFPTIDAVVASLYTADEVSMWQASLQADFALARGQANTSDAYDFGNGFAERNDPFHNDWKHWPKQPEAGFDL